MITLDEALLTSFGIPIIGRLLRGIPLNTILTARLPLSHNLQQSKINFSMLMSLLSRLNVASLRHLAIRIQRPLQRSQSTRIEELFSSRKSVRKRQSQFATKLSSIVTILHRGSLGITNKQITVRMMNSANLNLLNLNASKMLKLNNILKGIIRSSSTSTHILRQGRMLTRRTLSIDIIVQVRTRSTTRPQRTVSSRSLKFHNSMLDRTLLSLLDHFQRIGTYHINEKYIRTGRALSSGDKAILRIRSPYMQNIRLRHRRQLRQLKEPMGRIGLSKMRRTITIFVRRMLKHRVTRNRNRQISVQAMSQSFLRMLRSKSILIRSLNSILRTLSYSLRLRTLTSHRRLPMRNSNILWTLAIPIAIDGRSRTDVPRRLGLLENPKVHTIQDDNTTGASKNRNFNILLAFSSPRNLIHLSHDHSLQRTMRQDLTSARRRLPLPNRHLPRANTMTKSIQVGSTSMPTSLPDSSTTLSIRMIMIDIMLPINQSTFTKLKT